MKDIINIRKVKLNELILAGRNPFKENWSQNHTSIQVKKLFKYKYSLLKNYKDNFIGPVVSVAGRIIVFRLMGGATFLKLLDRDGYIQLYVSRNTLDKKEYDIWFKKLDIGDIIGVKGTTFITKTGEITVRVTTYKLLSKSIRPLPDKYHGITDYEIIYRHRYLDLISHAKSRNIFRIRSRVIEEIRKYLWNKDFLEVETPCLNIIAGGATAKPFITHFKSKNCNFYLRIALELYLKRLLVGGLDRVFEIGHVFRNEGISRRHNPEFTMLELYQAYTDYRGMMKLIQGLIIHLCKNVLNTYSIKRIYDDEVIRLDGNWCEITFSDIIIESLGDPYWINRNLKEKCLIFKNIGSSELIKTNTVFEKLVEPKLIQPTFVTKLPKIFSPLAKINNNDTLDVFELCINGQEIAPAYSEENDPNLQKKRLLEKTKNIDYDFIKALEYGMPPAGGMGIGIDRLLMLLTGSYNIRDVILFTS